MRPTALIAGTGRMGRSIGLHFLRSGFAVCWLSRDRERREAFQRAAIRDARRLARAFPGTDGPGRVATACYEEPWPAPAVFLEAVVEDGEAKAAVFEKVVPRLGAGALVLSSTSSFLPEDLHPDAVVVHFFSPPEVSGFVEVVWPAGCSAERKERVRDVVRSLGLDALEQTRERAFAATRLLLPLQNECLRALAQGAAPAAADEASRSPLFPTGQLTFLDRVGPATVLTAVRNYCSRMDGEEAVVFEPLVQGLKARLAKGSWERPPAPDDPSPPGEGSNVDARELLYVLLNACYRAVDSGLLNRRELGLVLSGFFWAETEPEAIVAAEGPERVLDVLQGAYRRTGLPYFRPSPSLEA